MIDPEPLMPPLRVYRVRRAGEDDRYLSLVGSNASIVRMTLSDRAVEEWPEYSTRSGSVAGGPFQLLAPNGSYRRAIAPRVGGSVYVLSAGLSDAELAALLGQVRFVPLDAWHAWVALLPSTSATPG